MNRVCRLYGQGDLRVEEDVLGTLAETSVLVDMKRGGICGSDIHYFQDGGIGTIRVAAPIILGHELSGVVRSVGTSVERVGVGDRIAINPSQPCGACGYCAKGLRQHCENMRFTGSAKTVPHVQGGFRDMLVVEAAQCHPIEAQVGFDEAACAEPLAVCLHAVAQAGALSGKRVLVTGAGPIGALSVAVSAHAGAREVVVTDLFDQTLDVARAMGATRAINVSATPDELNAEVAAHGPFDAVLECSAAAPALASAIAAVRPRGTIVQVGSGGSTPIPLNVLVGKEITLRGTMRFDEEFGEAVAHINAGTINVKPIVTHTLPLAEAVAAIELAADRSRSVKVQLALGR